MQNQSLRNSILVIMLLFFVVGCGTAPVAMTSKQSTTLMLKMYNAQFKDVKYVLESPTTTTEQKELATKKKDIFVKLYPLLDKYQEIVYAGGTPTEQQADEITALINELTALSLGGK